MRNFENPSLGVPGVLRQQNPEALGFANAKRQPPWTSAALSFAAITLLLASTALAQAPPVAREIYVPLDDLNVVLESDTQRVFLTRHEYEELLAKAKTTAERLAPIANAVTSAEYTARLEPGRALIEGKITLETLHEGLQLIPLQLSGVGVRSAVLDDQPAILHRDAQGAVMLVVESRGKHTLTLSLIAPLNTSAAQQTLQIELPHAPASQLALSVPGNVEVKSGAAVVRRTVDMEKGQTDLDLALTRGPLNIVLSLNNKLLAKDLVALARCVFVDEMTQSYERLHATVSLVVLHGAVENAQIEVPAGFEITSVASPLVSRWAVEEGVLNITLREPSTETVVLNISAVRNGSPPDDWRFPQLVVKNVAAQAAVVGLLLEDRLRVKSLAATSLVPIDTGVLSASIPPEVLAAGPGLPAIRPVAAYYAPHEAYSLAGAFERPPGQLWVTTSVLLTLGEQQQRAEVGLSLRPRAEELFLLEVVMPANWRAASIRRADGQPVGLERYVQDDGTTRLRITLPGGAPINVTTDLVLEASSVPAGWLDSWQEKTFTFPVFKVERADRTDGAIALAVSDDLLVRPEKIAGLLPLTEAERKQFELGRGAAALAYRHEGPLPEATFTAARTRPSIVAEVYNFHRLKPGVVESHFEMNYDVREAAVREVAFSLPASTPEQVAIRGLGEVAVKETRSEVVDGRRLWRLQLDQRRRGIIKIAADLEIRLAAEMPKGLVLPQAKAEGVAYQTGLVAVEGHPELDVSVTKHPRKVDEGELYAAEYQVGTRLIGAYGYLGAGDVQVDMIRHAAYALPTALSQQMRLVTQVGISGVSQTEANFTLRTKAAFLEIELPASAELWTITLDDRPTKPQKHQGRLLLSLPSVATEQDRVMKVVYQQPTRKIRLAGSVELVAPRLLVRETAADEAAEVPSADALWTLVLPTGYEARRSFGSVDVTLPAREPAAWRFLKMLAAWGYEPPRHVATMYDRSESIQTKDAATLGESSILSAQTAGEPMNAPHFELPVPLSAEDEAFDRFGGLRDDAARRMPNRAPESTTAELDELSKAQQKPNEGKADAPPAQTPAPNPPPQEGARVIDKLKGMAGLVIGVQADHCSTSLALTSLGESPEAGVTLVRREPLYALAWAAGLAVFGIGMYRAGKDAWTKATYVAGVLVASTVLPLVLPRVDTVGEAFDGAFFGAGFLGLTYLAMALGGAMSHATRRIRAYVKPRLAKLFGATASVLLLVSLSMTANAQPAPILLEKIAPLLIEDPKDVKVPDDAVIVPFDAADPEGVTKAEKVLVPYAQYLSLWNLAHPDKKLAGPEPPLSHGIGAARYEAQLGSDESLDVKGALDVELYTDKPVTIPLSLSGGVLLSAALDGKPARLQIVQPGAVPPGAAAEGSPVVTLLASGKGRKKLAFTYRFKLERQGGWRVARGTLPASGGGALVVKGPNAAAEIRLTGVVDRDAFETSKAGEEIESALGMPGQFTLSWRPKQAENMVDRGVAVQSRGVFDIRQDVLRLTWQMSFEFPRSRRDRLNLETPPGYIVERVVGENVRAWEAKKGDGINTQVEVTLLKEATDREAITVYLAKYGAVGQGEMATLSVPVVNAVGAPLQQAAVTLRRDPMLDVRITNSSDVTREDTILDDSLAQAAEAYDVGPLPVRVFQAYRFASLPATIALSISPLAVKTEAEVQAILNISERTTSVETRVIVSPHELPVFRVDIALPAELTDEEIDAILPGGFEQSIVVKNERRILTIYARSGQLQPFPITIVGKLTRGEDKSTVPLPQFEVLGVAQQQGTMVVQTDPAFDASVLIGAASEAAPVSSTFAWLGEQDRATARAAVRWRSPEYAAIVQLRTKTPVVSSRLFHNVRITARTLEQTIVADFQVSEAGIREVSLLIPQQLADARVTALNARRAVVEGAEGLPAGFVRLRIELEDEFQGVYKVQLVHDRLVSAQKQTIQLPVLELGTPQRRYLTVESAGRDEVIVEATVGLDSLTRGQQSYAELVSVLGGDTFAQAYTATSSSAGPALTISLKERETVETAAARIGLAETLLIVDRSGAYRARQSYRVDNSSEQILEVQLPAEAALWTVTVDGRPVKPVVGTIKGASGVRVPIIRRARGDADYEVALIYAGTVDRLSWWGRIDLPFMRSVNINVERSVVRLMVPESHAWFSFGGTLGQPVDEAGVQKTTQAYFQRQLGISLEVLRSGDKFASARAQNNLKQLGLALQNNYSYRGEAYSYDSSLARTYSENTQALQEGLRQAQQQVEGEVAQAQDDNRGRLNDFFNQQDVQRSKNVVGNDIRNFDEQREFRDRAGQPMAGKDAFTKQWLESNKLAQNNEATGKPSSRYDGGKKEAPGEKSADAGGEGQAAQRPRFNRGDAAGYGQQGGGQQQANAGDALDANREQAFDKYRSRLAKQTEEQQLQGQLFTPHAGPQTSAGSGGIGGGSFGDQQQPAVLPPGATDIDAAAVEVQMQDFGERVAQGRPTGLASLTLNLPHRGKEYRFVTARGDLQITAQYVDTAWLKRVGTLLVTLAVIALGFFASRRIDWAGFDGRFRWLGPVLLVLLGVILLAATSYPWWGLVILAIGALLLVRAALLRWALAAT